MRARDLDLGAQLQECVEQLQNPELITHEIRAAFHQLEQTFSSSAAFTPRPEEAASAPVESPFFYPSREIIVIRDSSSFTCIATGIDPVASAWTYGLDYTALTCTAEPQPVLGAMQSDHDSSAYPLLLRLLANLVEWIQSPTLAHLDRQHFRGMLDDSPRFDLHIMLWDEWTGEEGPPERAPLSQLSRDLAELIKANLKASDDFPDVVRDIVCLTMNPKRFDGRVRFDWRV